jgi:hypothetical protein
MAEPENWKHYAEFNNAGISAHSAIFVWMKEFEE